MSPIDANIRLLAYGWERFDTGEQEPAGMRVISNLTLHIPVRMCKTAGSFMSMSDVDTHVVCVLWGISKTPVVFFLPVTKNNHKYTIVHIKAVSNDYFCY